MTNTRNQLIAWFWGRALPKEYKHLAGKNPNTMSSKDIDHLVRIKTIVEECENMGIAIPFGKQLTITDIGEPNEF